MVISIDFDGTFSADPRMMREIIAVIKKHGHTPVLCTQRTPDYGRDVEQMVGTLVPIVYAGGKSKVKAMWEAGYKDVQFWMDDNPVSVVQPLRYRG